MSIHSEHPFATPEEDRDLVRRFRGRMVAPVSIWTAGSLPHAVGWTVSSFLVADGRPAEVIGLLDEEADLSDRLGPGTRFVVNLLAYEQSALAEAFAGLAPAPGGPFRMAEWRDTAWGPALVGAAAWLGARIPDVDTGGAAYAGWSRLIRGLVDRVDVAPALAAPLLAHARGRYHPVPAR